MLDSLLSVFFSVAAGVLICVLTARAWEWVYDSHACQDETVFVRTQDGWRIALHRYCHGKGRRGLPVILCHGLGGNLHSFDLKAAPSLARFLRDRGRDVWVVELRGSGHSDRPGIFWSDVPYSWGFRDHLAKDLPAAIDCVLGRTGAAAVHWMGHSMGGMLGLAHVACHDDQRVASVVALGSPLDFSKIPPRIFAMLLRIKWVLKLVPFAPMGIVARLFILALHHLPQYVQGLFYVPNIAPGTARRIVAVGSPLIISSKLWWDFGRFLETGVFASADGAAYVDRLGRSVTPVLSIAGSVDVLAPPQSASALCEASRPAGERVCLIVGRNTGCQEDYGHMDLLLGNHVRQEVYPPIADWLERCDKNEG